jgi:hypothetical protein
MGVWERSRFATTGVEYALQEAIVALQRVLEEGRVSLDTRESVMNTIAALREEQR